MLEKYMQLHLEQQFIYSGTLISSTISCNFGNGKQSTDSSMEMLT